MQKNLVAYQIWISLAPEVRHNLVILFDIPKSGHTVVEYRAGGNVVTSDGYTPSDLFAITTEKMQTVLQSDSEDFYGLFEQVVDNLDALMGGIFIPGSSRSSHQESSPRPRVSTEEVAEEHRIPEEYARDAFTWPQFVELHKGEGYTVKQLRKMHDELKLRK